MAEPTIAVLDVDGTLVDSNYQHALAWYRALRSMGETVPVWRLHRLIGMGGDQTGAGPAAGGAEEARRRAGRPQRDGRRLGVGHRGRQERRDAGDRRPV